MKMLEQVEALWNSRDKEQPFVKGILLTKPAGVEDSCNQRTQLVEKWFVLLGHSLFYCKDKGSAEYSGIFLTDLFNPVIARVNQKLLDTFQLPEDEQVSILKNRMLSNR